MNELSLDQRNAVVGVRGPEGRLHCIIAVHRKFRGAGEHHEAIVGQQGGECASAYAGHFKLIGGGKGLPLVAFALKEGRKDKEGNDCVYDEYDVMARMKEHHWQIPAYTLPDDAK